MARLNYKAIAPTGFDIFTRTLDYVAKSGLEESLVHLVYLRVSQINGCPYCVDAHWRDAIKAGVDARKLNAVIIFRDAPFFTDKENAALVWAEAVTTVVDQELMQRAYEGLKPHFASKESVDLTFGISQMNAINRLAIAFHAAPYANLPSAPA